MFPNNRGMSTHLSHTQITKYKASHLLVSPITVFIYSPHPTASSSKTKSKSADRLVGVGEVLLLGVESHIGGSTHPYLLALVDNELVVYRAFKYNQTQNPGHLQLRFGKVSQFHLFYCHISDIHVCIYMYQGVSMLTG